MAGSDIGKRLGAKGRKDLWNLAPEEYYSPRSDPSHEEHANWLIRTSPTDPDMIDLVASIREHGTDEGQPILVYLDGDRKCIAAGDRRQAACAIVNRERKAKRQPPHTLLARRTGDPVLARILENSCRKDDPPMVLARRYAKAAPSMGDPAIKGSGDIAAAAAMGHSLAYLNLLRACLLLPQDIQDRVNAREITPDVAARLARGGSEKAREAVKKATDPATGKVDPAKARDAARAAVPTRPKVRLGATLRGLREIVAATLEGIPGTENDAPVFIRRRAIVEALAWAEGGPCPEDMVKFEEEATAGRRRPVRQGARMTKGSSGKAGKS